MPDPNAALHGRSEHEPRTLDSPRWCAWCQKWGDHHTDRHPTGKCAGCGNIISAGVVPWEHAGGVVTHPNARCARGSRS